MPRPRTLIDRLDAVAERTGIPTLATRPPRRRHLRWLPLIPLGLATIALIAALGWAGWGPTLAAGVMTPAVGIASLFPILGPLKAWGTNERVDEFDVAARSRAFFFTFATISIVAVTGLWTISGLTLLDGWPRDQLLTALGFFTLYLILLFETLPTLHASWATDPIEEE